ncbi:hypothetical protein GA0061100_104565 [Rhizobium hainanense]|uniref:Uncharacterized protein n=1 Tax=Rhizobium hainanense TaxID=52131 RepID=A0A1C3V877_9HYPH|nr:hypothetical protein GA0061100_104565 [Rhizobium hainanense]
MGIRLPRRKSHDIARLEDMVAVFVNQCRRTRQNIEEFVLRHMPVA